MVTLNMESDKHFQEKLQVIHESVIQQEASKFSPELEVENVDPNDIACMVYTSGTTGMFLFHEMNFAQK
jgi:acyl-coenzyme A synthetase/AMP-(fatty) acid ligase